MVQAIENVMTHGPCNDTWIRCHERVIGTYGLAAAVGRVAAIHFDVAACPTDVAACPTDVAACPTRETAGR